MKSADLFESDKLTGYLDIRGLASELGVDQNRFIDAMDKLRMGQQEQLDIPEITELAHAFINMLGMDGPKKSILIGKLMSVKAQPTAPATNTNVQEDVTPFQPPSDSALTAPSPKYNLAIAKLGPAGRRLAHKQDNLTLPQLLKYFQGYQMRSRDLTERAWTNEDGTDAIYVVLGDGTPLGKNQIEQINAAIEKGYRA